MSSRLRLLIIDDYDMVGRGLKKLFESSLWCETCETASTMQDGLKKLHDLQPDVLLLDIYLRHETSFSFIPTIRATSPTTKIIMLTVSEEPDDFLQAARLAVDGYLAKSTPFEEMEKHIRAAASGSATVSPSLAPALYETLIAIESKPMLTRQEQKILACIQDGMSNQEIADEFHISLYTVKNHVSNILRKMKVSRRYQLMRPS